MHESMFMKFSLERPCFVCGKRVHSECAETICRRHHRTRWIFTACEIAIRPCTVHVRTEHCKASCFGQVQEWIFLWGLLEYGAGHLKKRLATGRRWLFRLRFLLDF